MMFKCRRADRQINQTRQIYLNDRHCDRAEQHRSIPSSAAVATAAEAADSVIEFFELGDEFSDIAIC
jgi:hypothetical protein